MRKLLQRLHAPNGEEPFARKSTRRKPPKCLWRSETFSTVQGLLDTAASGLPNAPSACARTMLGIFEPECRVPGLRQSAAALLRQIAWAGLSGRVTAEALPRCFGGVRRAGSEHLTVQEPAYPLGPRFADPRQGLARGCAPFDPPRRSALRRVVRVRPAADWSDRCRSRAAWRLRSRPMPVPDAVHVRVRATVCRRNLVGGMFRRALTRAVNMTVRRSAGGAPATGSGDAPPARCVGSRAQRRGIGQAALRRDHRSQGGRPLAPTRLLHGGRRTAVSSRSRITRTAW